MADGPVKIEPTRAGDWTLDGLVAQYEDAFVPGDKGIIRTSKDNLRYAVVGPMPGGGGPKTAYVVWDGGFSALIAETGQLTFDGLRGVDFSDVIISHARRPAELGGQTENQAFNLGGTHFIEGNRLDRAGMHLHGGPNSQKNAQLNKFLPRAVEAVFEQIQTFKAKPSG